MSQQRISQLQQTLLSGDGTTALAIARELAQTYPTAAEPVLYQALSHLRMGNPPQVLATLKPLLPHINRQPHVFYAALYALLAGNPSPSWPQVLAPLNQPETPILLAFLALTQQLAGAHLGNSPTVRSQLEARLNNLIPQLQNIPLSPRDDLEKADLSRALAIANAYANLLLSLPPAPESPAGLPTLWMLGDSHVLPAHGQQVVWQGQPHRIQGMLAMGVKWHHLKENAQNLQKTAALTQLSQIPNDAPLLISIGEIDTRPDEGIWPHARKTGQNPETLAQTTFSEGIAWLRQHHAGPLIISGTPYPQASRLQNLSPADKTAYTAFLTQANQTLCQIAHTHAHPFLDIFCLTQTEDWHLDGLHLRPEALPAAFVGHIRRPPLA